MQTILLIIVGSGTLSLLGLSLAHALSRNEGREWLTFLGLIFIFAAILWPLFN